MDSLQASQPSEPDEFEHNAAYDLIKLPPPPQIVLKKIEPTNYEESGKWYIPPTRVKTEMQKLIMELEDQMES